MIPDSELFALSSKLAAACERTAKGVHQSDCPTSKRPVTPECDDCTCHVRPAREALEAWRKYLAARSEAAEPPK